MFIYLTTIYATFGLWILTFWHVFRMTFFCAAGNLTDLELAQRAFRRAVAVEVWCCWRIWGKLCPVLTIPQENHQTYIGAMWLPSPVMGGKNDIVLPTWWFFGRWQWVSPRLLWLLCFFNFNFKLMMTSDSSTTISWLFSVVVHFGKQTSALEDRGKKPPVNYMVQWRYE